MDESAIDATIACDPRGETPADVMARLARLDGSVEHAGLEIARHLGRLLPLVPAGETRGFDLGNGQVLLIQHEPEAAIYGVFPLMVAGAVPWPVAGAS